MNSIKNNRNRIEEKELYFSEPVWCKVSGPLASVLRISRILGVAHLRFAPLDNAYKVSLNPNCVYHLYIYLAVLILVSILAYAHDYNVDDPKRNIRTLLGLSDIFFAVDCIMSNLIVMVVVFDMRNRMKRLIKYIHHIDMVNNNMSNGFRNYKERNCKIIIYSFIIVLTACAAYDIGDSFNNVLNNNLDLIMIPHTLCYQIKCAIRLSIQLQFFLIICLLNFSLELMNKQLIDLSMKLELFRSKPINVTSARTRTCRLFHAYLSICDIVVDFNREEGTVVLLILIYTVSDIMNCLYIMASAISLSVESIYNFLQSEKLAIVWVIYQTGNIILWMEPCHRAQDKFLAILNTISKLMCTPSRVKLPVLFDFHGFRMPTFRPHGIFDFTRSILVGVFGVITTFLVTIRQFDIKDKIYAEEFRQLQNISNVTYYK